MFLSSGDRLSIVQHVAADQSAHPQTRLLAILQVCGDKSAKFEENTIEEVTWNHEIETVIQRATLKAVGGAL